MNDQYSIIILPASGVILGVVSHTYTLATGEALIRRITVWGQHGQKVQETPFEPIKKQVGMVAGPVIPATWEALIGQPCCRPVWV